jgi:hypothetical protein
MIYFLKPLLVLAQRYINKPVLLLFFISAVAIVFRWPILFTELQTFAADTTRWAGPAVNFATNGLENLDFLPTTSYGPYGNITGGYQHYLTWPFMPSYILTGFVLLFGDNIWALRLLPLLLNIFSAMYIYLIVSKSFENRWWGVLGSTFFLFFPASVYYSLQVCDTQFWLLGAIASYYHLTKWMSQRQNFDAIAVTSWILFACSCSWFGYLFATITSIYLVTDLIKTNSVYKWSTLIHNPLPWLMGGLLVILTSHLYFIIDGIGFDDFKYLYSWRWDRWTGTTIVSSTLSGSGWLEYFEKAIRYRADMFINRTLFYQIPLYLSLPIATISACCLLLLVTHTLTRKEYKGQKQCWSIILFFCSFYFIYLAVLPAHIEHYSHIFVIQALTPPFTALLIYGARWIKCLLDALLVPKTLTYLPSGLLLLCFFSASWSYRINDPTYFNLGIKDKIESARSFGNIISNNTLETDLILTNQKSFSYWSNIMKFTARRTIKLDPEIEAMNFFIKDSRIKGVVFIYSDNMAEDLSKHKSPLLSYLKQAQMSKISIDNLKEFRNLTLYRLK